MRVALDTGSTSAGKETAAEWSAYVREQIRSRGWRQCDLASYLDTDARVVRYWVAGTCLPGRSLRRAVRLALAAPVEAEAMGHLRDALAALQRATAAPARAALPASPGEEQDWAAMAEGTGLDPDALRAAWLARQART